LRQALLGTWRLINVQVDVDGTTVKPFGDNPHGYLVYTPDGHVVVLFAARERPMLFSPSGGRGPRLVETAAANSPLGFLGYAGTFEVRDGQVIHHSEFHIIPSNDGRVEARTVVLDGDRLILRAPHGQQLEWQRVQ
jgi:hypothetical protein